MSLSEEVRSRCHVKHTIPRWQTDSANDQSLDSSSGNQNVRRQKSWDMLDQTAIAYARQQQHKVQHQVKINHGNFHLYAAISSLHKVLLF